MKRNIFVLGFSLVLLCSQTSSLRMGTITAEIMGIRKLSGTLYVALYASKDGFPDKEDKVYRTITEKVSAATHTVVFKDVPYGTYAVSVYQDVNSNGKMDMGLFGPLEPYGFSNNAKASLSPPPFSKAAFTVDSERCAITIELVH